VVALLSGCDKVLGLDEITTPPPLCPNLAMQPFLCADFDEATPVVYQDGAMTALPVATSATVHPPASTLPNALWIENPAQPYAITDAPSTPTVSVMHAELDLSVAGTPSQSYEVLELGVGPKTAALPCHVSVQVSANGELSMLPQCPTRDNAIGVVSIPQGFVHVVLDIDIGQGEAKMTVADSAVAPYSLPGTAQPGSPYASAGVLVTSGPIPTTGLDNLVVTATP